MYLGLRRFKPFFLCTILLIFLSFFQVTTTDDPVIRQLAKTTGNVFATEQILATLMCATRSVYSWDILVQRVGNKLFFDKRDDSGKEISSSSL